MIYFPLLLGYGMGRGFGGFGHGGGLGHFGGHRGGYGGKFTTFKYFLKS